MLFRSVAITNDAALTNPANDVITVSADTATQVVITGAGIDFAAGGTTTLTVEVQDTYGNLVSSDNTTTVTFSPTLSGTISDVTTGTGDGSYGAAGGAEAVTVAGGTATVVLTDTVAETFEVAITNGSGLTNPSNDSITVSPAAASEVVISGAGVDFAAGGSTTLTVEVHDAYGNLEIGRAHV